MADDMPLVALGEIAAVRDEKVLPSPGDTRPYIGLEHIASGSDRILGQLSAGSAASLKAVFQCGDILFGKLRPELRKVARARFDGVCSTDILPITPIDKDDGAFLYHILAGDDVYRAAVAQSAGTKMPRVSWSDLKRLKVPFPPLLARKTIANVLDGIDDAIEQTVAVIEAMETLRGALLQDLLTRGVPGWHKEWKQVQGIGTIPADWEVVPLGKLISDGPTNGIYKPESEYGSGTWLIRIDDFVPGAFVRLSGFDRVRTVGDEERRYLVVERDILINRVNSLSHIGKSVLVPHLAEPAMFESNMMRLRVGNEVDPRYAALVLLSKPSKNYFLARAKKAVQQASINQQDVCELPFPLPSTEEQQRIATLGDTITLEILAEREYLVRLKETKAAAAEALLTGQVCVAGRKVAS